MPLISFKRDPVRGHSAGKEKIFLEHYDWLLRAALTFTRGSRSRAEDLVHDLFVQFLLKLKGLEEVDDVRGYLYGMLRNVYASQLRRASRHAIQQLSILDHDSISVGLRAYDFSDQLETLSVLTRACEFVCHRKETTLTVSIFILRYFHCYYPVEIATLLGTSHDTVDKWLSRGRAEAKKYLAEPYPIPVIEKTDPRQSSKRLEELIATELSEAFIPCLSHIRRTVFVFWRNDVSSDHCELEGPTWSWKPSQNPCFAGKFKLVPKTISKLFSGLTSVSPLLFSHLGQC